MRDNLHIGIRGTSLDFLITETDKKIEQEYWDNITKGRRNLILMRKGNSRFYCEHRYKNYFFKHAGSDYNPDMAKILCEVAKDLMSQIYENNVVLMATYYQQLHTAYRNIWWQYRKPIYKEYGIIEDIKKQLLKCTDKVVYGTYETPFITYMRSIFWDFSINSPEKNFVILQEYLDTDMVDKMLDWAKESGRGISWRLYPYSAIKHQEAADKTVESCDKDMDYVIHIGVGRTYSGFCISLNPKYISFEKFITAIVPIFKKHGLDLYNVQDLYPTDYVVPTEEYLKTQELEEEKVREEERKAKLKAKEEEKKRKAAEKTEYPDSFKDFGKEVKSLGKDILGWFNNCYKNNLK